MDSDGVTPVAPRPELPPEDRAPEPGRRGVPRGLLWALALAVVVLLIASWVALDAEQSARESSNGDVAVLNNGLPAGGAPLRNQLDLVGRPAPDISFTAFDGTRATLADLRGRPVLLNFWASTCKPCVEEMPALERLHQRYRDRVDFLGISSGESLKLAEPMAEKTGVTYRLGLDSFYVAAKAFGVIALPATALIKPDGTVVWFTNVAGAIDEAEVATAIDEKLLA